MKCSTAFCNRPAPMPSLEVPAPFCKWCSENPGSGREQARREVHQAFVTMDVDLPDSETRFPLDAA